MAGWTPDIGEHPYPPANAMVIHSFMTGCLDLRWDDPSLLNTGPAAPTQATANVQVTGTPVVNVDATGTVTVGGTPIAVGLTLTVGTQALTAVAGARTPGNNDFNGTLGSTTLLAAEIADAIAGRRADPSDAPAATSPKVWITRSSRRSPARPPIASSAPRTRSSSSPCAPKSAGCQMAGEACAKGKGEKYGVEAMGGRGAHMGLMPRA